MLCIVLGTAEGLARLLGREALQQAASPPPESVEGAPNLLGNPYLLYEMAPGKRFENDIDVAINAYGLRGPEWTRDKPAGVRRIMALGDSSVYGFGVEDDEVFTARLGQAMGESVQVINAAVPGYSTYQTINLLQIRALSLEPDLLLVGCIWSDNNFDSFVDRDLLAAYSTFRNHRARAVKETLKRSSLYTILDYKLRVLRKFPEDRRVGWMIGRGEKIGQRRVPIQEYAANLEIITELAHDAGAEVAFMVLPNREDLTMVHQSGAAWDPYRQVMRDTATRHGAPLMYLPELFEETGLEADELFLDEMHPTAKGHALWADLVLETLDELSWPDGQPAERDPQPSPLPAYEDPFVEGDHAPPEGAEPPPAHGSADQPDPTAPRIVGTLLAAEGQEDTTFQLDVITAGVSQPTILGTQRAQGGGSFEIYLNDRVEAVAFIVYIDSNGDGPGPGDTRIDLFTTGLELPDEGDLEGVELDLSTGTAVQTFDGSAATAQPPRDASNEGPADLPPVPSTGPLVTDQSGTIPGQQPGTIVTDQPAGGARE